MVNLTSFNQRKEFSMSSHSKDKPNKAFGLKLASHRNRQRMGLERFMLLVNLLGSEKGIPHFSMYVLDRMEEGEKVVEDFRLLEVMCQVLKLTSWQRVELCVLADYSILAGTASKPTSV